MQNSDAKIAGSTFGLWRRFTARIRRGRLPSTLLLFIRRVMRIGFVGGILAMVCVPISAQSLYKEIEVTSGGTITGAVHLVGDPSKSVKLEITKDHSCCGSAKVSPRLVVGKAGAVKNAVVYLDAITEGKKFPVTPKVLLNQKKCEYDPHVLIVPQGTQMDIVNGDPILHNVHAYCGMQSTFNIAQPIKGQCTTIKRTQLSKPGPVTLTCDAGHPWMSGFVFVAPHPYYAITDKNGNFRLENVPPGKYTLRMWHEGVAVVDKEIEQEKVKKYIFEVPYEITKEVTVGGGSTVAVDFEFALR